MRFPWICSGRVDTVLKMDDRMLRFFKHSGLMHMYFGIESGSSRILRLINKGIDPEMVMQLNLKMKEHEIRPHYSFMARFPTETKEEVEETIGLMNRLKQDNPDAVLWKINQYTPYPGTELFNVAVDQGFKVPEKFEDWNHVRFYSKEYNAPYDMRL